MICDTAAGKLFERYLKTKIIGRVEMSISICNVSVGLKKNSHLVFGYNVLF